MDGLGTGCVRIKGWRSGCVWVEGGDLGVYGRQGRKLAVWVVATAGTGCMQGEDVELRPRWWCLSDEIVLQPFLSFLDGAALTDTSSLCWP